MPANPMGAAPAAPAGPWPADPAVPADPVVPADPAVSAVPEEPPAADPPVAADAPANPGRAPVAAASESASSPLVPPAWEPSRDPLAPAASALGSVAALRPPTGAPSLLEPPVDVAGALGACLLSDPVEPVDAPPPTAVDPGGLWDESRCPGSGGSGLSPHAASANARMAHPRTRYDDLAIPGQRIARTGTREGSGRFTAKLAPNGGPTGTVVLRRSGR